MSTLKDSVMSFRFKGPILQTEYVFALLHYGSHILLYIGFL